MTRNPSPTKLRLLTLDTNTNRDQRQYEQPRDQTPSSTCYYREERAVPTAPKMALQDDRNKRPFTGGRGDKWNNDAQFRAQNQYEYDANSKQKLEEAKGNDYRDQRHSTTVIVGKSGQRPTTRQNEFPAKSGTTYQSRVYSSPGHHPQQEQNLMYRNNRQMIEFVTFRDQPNNRASTVTDL